MLVNMYFSRIARILLTTIVVFSSLGDTQELILDDLVLDLND